MRLSAFVRVSVLPSCAETVSNADNTQDKLPQHILTTISNQGSMAAARLRRAVAICHQGHHRGFLAYFPVVHAERGLANRAS
jgi:hypothetical protein